MEKHTPTPWEARNGSIYPVKSDGTAIAQFVIKQEDADFIVRACNSHEELLEALKQAMPFMVDLGNDGDQQAQIVGSFMDTVIAKAEGK